MRRVQAMGSVPASFAGEPVMGRGIGRASIGCPLHDVVRLPGGCLTSSDAEPLMTEPIDSATLEN